MAREEHRVDPQVWRACAGNLTHIPELNSRVYYFPQGHIEQSSDAIAVNQAWGTNSAIMCRVIDIVFLVDSQTDEVFVKFALQRCTTSDFASNNPSSPSSSSSSSSGSGVDDNNGVVSYAKKLTKSDAGNGGGFSVPKLCADTIFPRLDFDMEPPLQYLTVSDVRGNDPNNPPFEFRHIFRGTPRRHLLTSGWSVFVNKKKLIEDDTVVFIKRTVGDTDELFVGVRRTFRSAFTIPEGLAALVDMSNIVSRGVGREGEKRGLGGFSRLNKGRLAPKEVVEAIEKAVGGSMFEAAYYPRPGFPEFVVAAEKVEKAIGHAWTDGLRVRIARDTDDGTRFIWHNGTIASVGMDPDRDAWAGSCWRLLQVAWDEPDTLKDLKTVNPWQVEIVGALPEPPEAPRAKRQRGVQNSELLTDKEGDPPVPSINLNQLDSSFLNYNSIPVGMQGARQNNTVTSDLSNMVHCDDASLLQSVVAESADLNMGDSLPEAPLPDNHNTSNMVHRDDVSLLQSVVAESAIPDIGNSLPEAPLPDNHNTSNMVHRDGVSLLQRVVAESTNLNVGNSLPEAPSPDDHTSVQRFITADAEQNQGALTSNGISSIMLFGRVIIE